MSFVPSLRARVKRLEDAAAVRAGSTQTIGAALAEARARCPQAPTQTRAELERIAAAEPPGSMLGRIARARLRVRAYIPADGPG